MAWRAVALFQKGSIGVANLVSTVSYQTTPNTLPRLASSVQLIYSPEPFLWLCVPESKRWFPSNRRSFFAVMEKADPSPPPPPYTLGRASKQFCIKRFQHWPFP